MNLLVSEEERSNWEATIWEATWEVSGRLSGRPIISRSDLPRTHNQRVTTEIPLFEPTTSRSQNQTEDHRTLGTQQATVGTAPGQRAQKSGHRSPKHVSTRTATASDLAPVER